MDEKKLELKRRFAGEKKPSMKRRSSMHDYHAQRFYMITLAVRDRCPVLGRLVYGVSAHEDAHIELSEMGQAVADEWAGISHYYPQVGVIAGQVMPVHFHGILYVREDVPFHLGQVIKGFKLGCNRKLKLILGEAAMESPLAREGGVPHGREGSDVLRSFAAILSQPKGGFGLWEEGYNDLILHNYSTLNKWKAYIQDNPRRLAIRRLHPDFFKVRFGLTIAGQEYAAIGNRFLLEQPELVQVQLSRHLYDNEIEQQKQQLLEKARKGAVLVSPAISKGEQLVMRAALDEHLPLIFLTAWGFNQFSKPGHQYFQACAEGRLLLLAPWEHQNERILLTRDMCMALNGMVESICKR